MWRRRSQRLSSATRRPRTAILDLQRHHVAQTPFQRCLVCAVTAYRANLNVSIRPHEPPPAHPAPSAHSGGSCHRTGARRVHRAQADGARCVSAARHPDDLCGAALRRHGSGADGGLPHLLLRISLSLHHGHRARGVEVDPRRVGDEAPVPARHGHVGGDVGGGRVCEPRTRVHARRHAGAVHHAVRRGQRRRGLPRIFVE